MLFVHWFLSPFNPIGVERRVRSHMFGARFSLPAATLLAGIALLHGVSHGEPVSLRQPLGHIPMAMDSWLGHDDPLDARIVTALGVSDYINRSYLSAAGQPVGLYVGYYQSQRTGETIHSPRTASLAPAGSQCAPVI